VDVTRFYPAGIAPLQRVLTAEVAEHLPHRLGDDLEWLAGSIDAGLADQKGLVKEPASFAALDEQESVPVGVL
jgi:hypothetical protein